MLGLEQSRHSGPDLLLGEAPLYFYLIGVVEYALA